MKKIIVIFLVIISIFSVYNNKKKNEIVRVPDEAIRFRVIANSNSPRDQKIKMDVKERMQKELYNVLKSANNINDVRTLINNNMDNFNNVVSKEMDDIEYSYTMDYGMHNFPEKKYKGVTYDEGMYESLLITLGKGEGNNFWCVLFPPMCLLEAEETNDNRNNVEYKSLIKELIEKYF